MIVVSDRPLTPTAEAWLHESEAWWRRAHRIAALHPELDPGDIYHVLATLHETPTERVRRSLAHGRLRPRARSARVPTERETQPVRQLSMGSS